MYFFQVSLHFKRKRQVIVSRYTSAYEGSDKVDFILNLRMKNASMKVNCINRRRKTRFTLRMTADWHFR